METSFEWDEQKNQANIKKHGVSFFEAQRGRINVIPDFLPKPSELVPKEETIKVTLLLTKESVDFFKREAEEQHTQYQKMIRALVDMYAHNYDRAQKNKRRMAG